MNSIWPIERLPLDLPSARVLSFGYNTMLAGHISLSVRNLGRSLLEATSQTRSTLNATQRPLIFVAHSLGGLIVKQALVYAHALRDVDFESYSILEMTRGCCFLSTPHTGFRKSSWDPAISRISMVLTSQSPTTTQNLQKIFKSAEGDDMLQTCSLFTDIIAHKNIPILSFFEKLSSSTTRGKIIVCPSLSTHVKFEAKLYADSNPRINHYRRSK